MKPFDVVRLVRLRDDRLSKGNPHYQRLPAIGDIGTILEAYETPEPAFEIECSDPKTGRTIWLDAIYPDELELVDVAR